MAMRNVTTTLERDWWTAKERAMCRDLAAKGEAITHMSCLPMAELEHLNSIAAETRACLTSEREILDAMAALEHQMEILRAPLPFVVGGAR